MIPNHAAAHILSQRIFIEEVRARHRSVRVCYISRVYTTRSPSIVPYSGAAKGGGDMVSGKMLTEEWIAENGFLVSSSTLCSWEHNMRLNQNKTGRTKTYPVQIRGRLHALTVLCPKHAAAGVVSKSHESL